jgi:hypothetical protein
MTSDVQRTAFILLAFQGMDHGMEAVIRIKAEGFVLNTSMFEDSRSLLQNKIK